MKVIDDTVLDQFRWAPACERCGRRVAPLDPHHAFRKRGFGGGTRLDLAVQMAGLCRICHTNAESSKAIELEVQEIVARREKTTVQKIHDYLNLVLRTPKEKPMPAWKAKRTA